LLLERVTLKRGTNCQLRGIELSQISFRCLSNADDSEFLSNGTRNWSQWPVPALTFNCLLRWVPLLRPA